MKQSQFKIKSIIGRVHDTSFGGYPYKVIVSLEVDSAYFRSLKGDIGSLVIDVNNAVYFHNENIPSYSPHVGGLKDRSSKGVKRLEFVYYFQDHSRAEKLGFKILKLRNGDCLPEYAQYVNIL